MTCRDCIHESICSFLTNEYFDWNKFTSKEIEKECEHFLNVREIQKTKNLNNTKILCYKCKGENLWDL